MNGGEDDEDDDDEEESDRPPRFHAHRTDPPPNRRTRPPDRGRRNGRSARLPDLLLPWLAGIALARGRVQRGSAGARPAHSFAGSAGDRALDAAARPAAARLAARGPRNRAAARVSALRGDGGFRRRAVR